MRRICTLLLLIAGCAGGSDDTKPDATATLAALGGSGVQGTVTFTKIDDGKLRIVADVRGLKPGKHGVHVHEFGDCSAADGESAGGHFNPKSVEHGAPGAGAHHPGDFGNLEADAGGHASMTLTIDPTPLSLGGGEADVLGRAIIVHADPDDFGQPTGNAGGRVACGVIQGAAGATPPRLNPRPGA